MAASSPKRQQLPPPPPQAMAPAHGVEGAQQPLGASEEDFLDLQENVGRDHRSTWRLNFVLTTAYLLIVFLLVAGAVTWHHWAHR